jgi:hypothetical protein
LVHAVDDGSLLAWLEALLSLAFASELLFELVDEARLLEEDELNSLDDVVLELEDEDELDMLDGEVPLEPPPPQPTIIPLEMIKYKYSPIFDRII